MAVDGRSNELRALFWRLVLERTGSSYTGPGVTALRWVRLIPAASLSPLISDKELSESPVPGTLEATIR